MRVYGSGAEGCEENDLIAPTLRKSTRKLLFAKDPRLRDSSISGVRPAFVFYSSLWYRHHDVAR